MLAEASALEELLADSALDSLTDSLLDEDDELAVLWDSLAELPDVPDEAEELEEELPDELIEELCELELLSLPEEVLLL